MSLVLFTVLFLNSVAPSIDLWVDKESAEYYSSENLKVFFQTDRDCYVAIYNIDVGGRASLLFPLEGEDGWVTGGRIYELPPEYADFDYVVSGEEGIEKIIALASPERLPDLIDEGPDMVEKSIEIYVKEPEPARFRVVSTPKGCRVFITEVGSGEEEYIGKAPCTIALRPGEYVVEIEKFGYHTMKRKIWLDPGERRRVFVKLRPY